MYYHIHMFMLRKHLRDSRTTTAECKSVDSNLKCQISMPSMVIVSL